MVLTVAELRTLIRNYKKAQYPQALSSMKRHDLIVLAFAHKLIESHHISKRDFELYNEMLKPKAAVAVKTVAPPKPEPADVETEVIKALVPKQEPTQSQLADFKKVVFENAEKRAIYHRLVLHNKGFEKNHNGSFVRICIPFMTLPAVEFEKRLRHIVEKATSEIYDRS